MPKEENFQVPFRNSECGSCQSNNSENREEKVISKCRIISSHCFALIAVTMFKFTYGICSGFTIIIIPELYKADAEIIMSLDELTWFSSYCFMHPVGALLGGFLAQGIGCRLLLVISGISYITSGLIFYWSTNAAMLLCAQAIVGFVSGMQKGPTYTYLAEISLPKFRSFFMSCIGLCATSGLFITTVLGNYLNWRTLAVVNVTYPAIGIVLLYFLPESPYWLASKNRYEDAKRSLAWFRGWTTPESVEGEMRSVLSNSEEPSSSSLSEPTKHLHSNSRRLDHLKQTLKMYLDRSFYTPFFMITFVIVIKMLEGTSIMSVFSVIVFTNINSPVDPHVATMLFSASRVIGSIGCTAFIKLAGKRMLLFLTLALSGIALGIAAVFSYLTNANTLLHVAYRWTSMFSIIVAVVSTSVGIDKICLLLNSEIFPLHLRHIGVGAGHFLNLVLYALLAKVFLYVVDAITMSGMLLVFAVVNIVGLIGTYFIVPETEGKTLKEIEDDFAGKRGLTKKEAKEI